MLQNKLFRTFYTVILLIGAMYASATSYYQCRSGNWNNPTTWTTDASWQASVNNGTYPQVGDDVHFKNNANLATVTLTADAECANLYFDGSEPACVLNMGNYNLTIDASWTIDWSSNATISQGTGYLQVNGSIPMFKTDKTIANFRVGSGTFSFTQTNSIALTVSSNYDYNCFQSTIPTGISAGNAVKSHATPCNPTLTATSLAGFGSVCTGALTSANSFVISGLMLNSDNINVAALNGYSYSTSVDGTYSSTLSIPQSGGNVSKTVYVKFNPQSSATYSGNIVVSGGGASAIQVAASGIGSNSVAPAISTPTASNVLATSATLAATITVAGCTSDYVTERGFYYSTTSGFANGTGTKVSETGTFGTGAFSLNVTGLSASTTYYFKSFARNSNGIAYSSEATFSNAPRTYYSRQSGNWTSTTTWSTESCGGVINNGTYPHAVDNVIICQQHNITVNTTGLACNNIDMSSYACQLLLAADFTINGNLLLTSQSYVSAGANNLTILGDFANTPNEFNSRIDYSTGNVSIGGNITVLKNGIEPFNCSSSGWLILSGAAKTFTTNSGLTVPRLKQPTASFNKAGSGAITVSNTFDQNFGPEAPAGVVISIPANTINIPASYFRSVGNGDWNTTTTWQKSTDGGSSWTSSLSVPTSNDDVVSIQSGHTVTINNATTVKNLSIQSSGVLVVNPAQQLTCTISLTNYGSLNLKSDVTGSATLLTPATVGGNGTVNVEQFLYGKSGSSGRGWWYVSSPVNNATSSVFNPEGGVNKFGYYDEPQFAYSQIMVNSTALTVGKGYVVYLGGNNATYVFSGTPNSGDIILHPARTGTANGSRGFNLVGNPYPSYINWNAASKANVSNTIWYRTAASGNGAMTFDTFDGTVGTANGNNGRVSQYIPPMQAFWVKVSADGDNGTITFHNDDRSHRDQSLATNRLRVKALAADPLGIIRLKVSNDTNSDETILVSNPNASDAADSFDSPKMAVNNADIPEIYSLVGNDEMVINHLNSIDANKSINLGFRTGKSGVFSILVNEISNIGISLKTILIDNVTNSQFDLTSGSAYTFSSDATVTNTRFSIQFKSADVVNSIQNESAAKVVVYGNVARQIVVDLNSQPTAAGTMAVYNTMGQKLLDCQVIGNIATPDRRFAPGIYMVELVVNNQRTIKKVVLQ